MVPILKETNILIESLFGHHFYLHPSFQVYFLNSWYVKDLDYLKQSRVLLLVFLEYLKGYRSQFSIILLVTIMASNLSNESRSLNHWRQEKWLFRYLFHWPIWFLPLSCYQSLQVKFLYKEEHRLQHPQGRAMEACSYSYHLKWSMGHPAMVAVKMANATC